MENKNEKGFNLSFQEEALILAVLIIAAGIGFADGYYTRFGFRYDVLDFSFEKILYQGIKVSRYKPTILGLYVLQFVLIILSKWTNKELAVKWLQTLTYIYTFIMLFWVNKIAQKEGAIIAYTDMHFEHTALPKVQSLISKQLNIQPPEDTYLLFSANQDFVIVFEPLKKEETNIYPIVKRIPREQVDLIQTY